MRGTMGKFTKEESELIDELYRQVTTVTDEPDEVYIHQPPVFTINEEDMKSDNQRNSWVFEEDKQKWSRVLFDDLKSAFEDSECIDNEDEEEDWETESDEVSSPHHYKVIGSLEAIDIIKELLGPEQFIAYCYGNIIKYSLRAKKKEAFVKDIGKIKKYCEFILGEDKE